MAANPLTPKQLAMISLISVKLPDEVDQVCVAFWLIARVILSATTNIAECQEACEIAGRDLFRSIRATIEAARPR